MSSKLRCTLSSSSSSSCGISLFTCVTQPARQRKRPELIFNFRWQNNPERCIEIKNAISNDICTHKKCVYLCSIFSFSLYAALLPESCFGWNFISFRFSFRFEPSSCSIIISSVIFFGCCCCLVDEIHLDCQYFEWPLNEIPFGLMHSACLNCISQSHVKRRKFPSTVSLLIVSEIPSFACHEKLTLFLSEWNGTHTHKHTRVQVTEMDWMCVCIWLVVSWMMWDQSSGVSINDTEFAPIISNTKSFQHVSHKYKRAPTAIIIRESRMSTFSIAQT